MAAPRNTPLPAPDEDGCIIRKPRARKTVGGILLPADAATRPEPVVYDIEGFEFVADKPLSPARLAALRHLIIADPVAILVSDRMSSVDLKPAQVPINLEEFLFELVVLQGTLSHVRSMELLYLRCVRSFFAAEFKSALTDEQKRAFNDRWTKWMATFGGGILERYGGKVRNTILAGEHIDDPALSVEEKKDRAARTAWTVVALESRHPVLADVDWSDKDGTPKLFVQCGPERGAVPKSFTERSESVEEAARQVEEQYKQICKAYGIEA